MEKLTHIDEAGRPRMVDVSEKKETLRRAAAKGTVLMKKETLERIRQGTAAKGDVLSVAQTAGIMGAKNTALNIPMCHNIFITGVSMDFETDETLPGIHITARAVTESRTGIEMEALSAVTMAALTIYDMCKAMDRSMRITDIRLTEKSGGASGVYREDPGAAGEKVCPEPEYGVEKGSVVSLNISEKTGEIKNPVAEAVFLDARGISGDAHCGLSEIRQVSLLAEESAEKIRRMGLSVGAGAFAENITTRGIVLKNLPVGTRLRIGETLQEVSQIGKECHHGCAIKETTGTCVMPTEGIFTRVLKGGRIRTGDPIFVLRD